MEKRDVVPYGKLSKKARRELDRKKRRDWGGLNPVTRKPENPGAYSRSRQKARDRREGGESALLLFECFNEMTAI